jgi:hypothetical protein
MKTKLASVFAGCALLAMSACSKSNSSASSNASIVFVNGCVGATSTSLTVNGTALSNASNVAYLGNSGYQSVATGSVTLNASLTGVGTLGTIAANLSTSHTYSFFECGTVLADSVILVDDAMPSPSGGYAYVRLVNASSDTTAKAITAAVGNNVVGANVAYAAVSSWTQVSSGTYSLTAFNVNSPGNVATLSGTTINAGNFYTLLYTGNSNQSVGFKLTLIGNN